MITREKEEVQGGREKGSSDEAEAPSPMEVMEMA